MASHFSRSSLIRTPFRAPFFCACSRFRSLPYSRSVQIALQLCPICPPIVSNFSTKIRLAVKVDQEITSATVSGHGRGGRLWWNHGLGHGGLHDRGPSLPQMARHGQGHGRGQTVAKPWPTSFGRGLVMSHPLLAPFSRAFLLFRSRFIQIISNLNKHKMCVNIALNTQ